MQSILESGPLHDSKREVRYWKDWLTLGSTFSSSWKIKIGAEVVCKIRILMRLIYEIFVSLWNGLISFYNILQNFLLSLYSWPDVSQNWRKTLLYPFLDTCCLALGFKISVSWRIFQIISPQNIFLLTYLSFESFEKEWVARVLELSGYKLNKR